MRAPARLLTASALALACASNDRPTTRRDAGSEASADARPYEDLPLPDVPSAPCMPGYAYCEADTRYTCTDQGEIVNRAPCGGATPRCVPGLGCVACVPGATRCDPADANRAQTCRADGSGYTAGVACNAADGESCLGGVCAGRCSESALGLSYIGCDYWPAVTPNAGLDPLFEYAVVLTNPQTYPVHAQIQGGALAAPREIDLAPGAIETVVLPWVTELIQHVPDCVRIGNLCLQGNPASSVLRRGGAYHVHANGPITAYQFNPLTFSRPGGYYSYTNDASLLLPEGVLTQRYTVVTYRNFPWMKGMYVYGGFASVVAVTGETTDVTVRASAAIRAGNGVPPIARGASRTFQLQPGDVLQLVGERVGEDLTGTTIEASHRVAVFVGNDCTNVPTDREACDHLEEQLLPNEAWGRSYMVSALRDRGPNVDALVRIVSRTDDNDVTFDPPATHAPQRLRAGEWMEFPASRHFVVRGSGPLLVAQFMIGQGSPIGGLGSGDPAMALEVPIEQYRTEYSFTVPSTYERNFVNVVIPDGGRLEMDGALLRGSSESVAGMTVYTLPITPGEHRVRSTSGEGFALKVYGIAPYTSYMYPGGLDLRRITPG